MRALLTTALIATALAGCAGGFSGLGGSSQYGCQAPKGSACMSISGVYANGPQGQRAPVNSGTKPAAIAPYVGNASATNPTMTDPSRNEALRTNPRVLRLWIAPWEDSDGDLHDESTLHVLVDTGRWRLPHERATPKPTQDVKVPATPRQEAIPPRPGTSSIPIAPH